MNIFNLLRFGRRNPLPVRPWLDEPLLTLSAFDDWTHRDAMRHALIFGASGSGKTNFVARRFVLDYMRSNYGMLMLCAKPSDKDMYLEWAKEAGRKSDVLVFEPGGAHTLNMLAWQQNAAKGQGVALNIVSLFNVVLEMIERSSGGEGDNPYWPRAAKECLHYACSLLELAGEEISALVLYVLITSAPVAPVTKCDDVFWHVFFKAGKSAVSPEGQADFRLAEHYFTNNFAKLEGKTRSIVISIIVSMLNPFIQSPLREMFGSETTLTPEDVYKRRNILIVNLSPSEYFELGRIGSVTLKYIFQRALLARNIAEENQPFCIFSDEYHQFASSFDATFTALCRSQLVSCLSVIQNLPMLYSSLGGNEKAKHEAEALMGLYGTKIFSQNSCFETNRWASDMIGREIKVFANSSISIANREPFYTLGMPDTNYTGGLSESYEQMIQPNRFVSLKTPGDCAEVIIFSSGRTFNHSRRTFLSTVFRR